MSISFSGLASGLDTSSWVESMTALKRAKIESYEAEKESVVSMQETLENIKSFFTSFRSMIEKVTDAKFGIPETDIFAQMLATSSDTSILTASATTEAEEGVYDVSVDNLATSTNVSSGFKTTTTILQTQTATLDSKLSSLGVKSGDIRVTINSNQYTISIEEDDTLADFISSLRNIGAEASYNEETGVFSVNLKGGSIDDTIVVQSDGTRGTGILEALNLAETGGYESDNLEIVTTETLIEAATSSTKLSELGEILNGKIEVESDSGSFTMNITDKTTLGDLITNLTSHGIDATLDNNGVLKINDAVIKDTGGTGIIDALGLETDIYSKSQTADNLQTKTVTTTLTYADGDTMLKELDGWDKLGTNPTLKVENPSGVTTTITVSGETTLDDIISSLANSGVSAVLNSEGILSVSGGEISGSVAEFLGIDSASKNTGGIYTSGEILYASHTVYASGSTTLGDLNILNATRAGSGYNFAVFDSSNKFITELSVDASTSIDDIFSMLAAYGINGTINDGRIVLSSTNGNYVQGDIAEKLGLGTVSSITTTGSSVTSTSPVTGTVTLNADETTTFAEAGLDLSGKTLTIKSKDTNDTIGTITVSSNSTTFGDLFAELAAYGVSGSISSGRVVLNTGGNYVTGEVATLLGIGVSSSTSTIGASVTSTAPLTYTTSSVADTSSKMSEYITVGSNNKILLHNENTTTTFTVTQTTTFGELINAFTSAGINVSMSNGRIIFSDSDGKYAEDAVATDGVLKSLGIGTVTTTITGGEVTSATRYESYEELATKIYALSDDTKFGDVWYGYKEEHTFTITNGATEERLAIITVHASDTIVDLRAALEQANVSKYITTQWNDKGLYFDIDEFIVLDGEFLDAMRISHYNDKPSTFYESGFIVPTSLTSLTLVIDAEQLDYGWEIGVLDQGNYYLESFGSYHTYLDLIDWLNSHGIDATFDSGKIVIDSNSTSYVAYINPPYINNLETYVGLRGKGYYETSGMLVGMQTSIVSETTSLYNYTGTYNTVKILSTDNGTLEYYFDFSNTIQDLVAAINDFGVSASYIDGKLTIDGNGQNITLGEEFASYFNLAATGDGVTTQKIVATEESKISDYIDFTAIYYKKEIHLVNPYSLNTTASFTVSDSTTFGELIDFFNSNGGTASIENGILEVEIKGAYILENGPGGYSDPSIVEALGLKAPQNIYHTPLQTYSNTLLPLTTSKISDFYDIDETNNEIIINDYYTLEKLCTITISETTTFDDIRQAYNSLGIGNLDIYTDGSNIHFESCAFFSGSFMNLASPYYDETNLSSIAYAPSTTKTYLVVLNSLTSGSLTIFSNGQYYKLAGKVSQSEVLDWLQSHDFFIEESDMNNYYNITMDSSHYLVSQRDRNKFIYFVDDEYWQDTISNHTIIDVPLGGSGYQEGITKNSLLTNFGLEVGEVLDIGVNISGDLHFTVLTNSTIADLDSAMKNINSYRGLNVINNNGYSYLEFDVGYMPQSIVEKFHIVNNYGSYYYTAFQENSYNYSSKSFIQYNTLYGSVTGSNTSSSTQGEVSTQTALSDTTLGALGLTSDGVITVADKNGGSKDITIKTSDTIADLKDKLGDIDVSFADGKVTLSGDENAWISSITNNLKDVLKLPGSGEGYTFTETGNTSYTNTPSNKTFQQVTTEPVDEDTKLGNIDGYSNGNGTVTIHRPDGSEVTITLRAEDTLGDFFDMISNFGLSGSVYSSGVINITSNDGTYLKSASGGSNILSSLHFGNTTISTQTTISNTTSGGGISMPETSAANSTVKLEDLELADGTKINFDSSGNASLILSLTNHNGTVRHTTISFSKTQTLDEVLQALTSNGLNAHIEGSRIAINTNTLADFDIAGTLGEFLMGDYIKTYETQSDSLVVENTTTTTSAATRDTLLSEFGVTSGEYYIYNNGVKYTAFISSDETLGSFIDTLNSFGIQTGLIVNGDKAQLVITGQGDSYIVKSQNTAGASNVVEKLFGPNIDESFSYTGDEQFYSTVTHTQTATLDTLLSEFDTPWGGTTLKSEGDLYFNINGEDKVIHITADETFGSLINKLQAAGVAAAFLNGKLYISNSGGLSINTAKTTSSIMNQYATVKLEYKDSLNGFLTSTDAVEQTKTIIEEKTISAANYADLNSKLKTLNISSGSLSIYRDGQKALINIDAEDTFAELRAQIAGQFSDVDLKFEDGYLVIYSKTDGINVEVGTTTDTSNFLAITGMTKNEEGGTSKSARALYAVNADSVITQSGLFRKGSVTEGTFVVGTATFTIMQDTTIGDIVSQINNSDGANATAYWDSVDGKLVIQSRTTGAALINIEAGTSNFTNILGYTDYSLLSPVTGRPEGSKLNVSAQMLGENAHFSINGVRYTSASNTITSDISRIKGVTINLKNVTKENPVQLTIEKDKETVANALSDIVDSYNELMKNIDEAIAIDGELHDQTVLKMIRNQLRSLMTSSDLGTSVFKNLYAIGIVTDAANGSDISTTNDRVVNLAFDKDKFLKAYDSDAKAVKELLVGGDNNKGIFINVETVLESALEEVSGYFASTKEAYQRDIDKLDDKIVRGNEQIERYRERLEHKFASMDLLIGNVQQQYSTFLIS